MNTQKTEIEWNILIGLFRSTVEQTNMLTGQPKQEAKLIFKRWTNEGQRLLKLIEDSSNEEKLDHITELIEDSVHQIRQ